MTTLGDLFDTAGRHLRVAAETTLAATDPVYGAAQTKHLDRFLSHLQDSLGTNGDGPALSPTAEDLTFHLGKARAALQTAQRLLPAPGLGADGYELADATLAVTAVRDMIESHRGPDRAPVTAYAYVFSARPAHDYLTQRCAELAWEAGRIAHALSQGAEDPGVAAALASARAYLDQASVFGRAGTRQADPGVAAFPLALPVQPVQASTSDATANIRDRLGEDCERLSRVAFETLHDRTAHRLSGSDLQELSRWTAMTRLLSGRVLRRVAEQTPDAAVADALREAADSLRGSARAWQEAAAAWRRIVDVADPRAHPELPLPSYEIVRQGKVVQLPQVVPHPATVIAHTSAIRVGQLLFGAQWRPEQRPGEARAADAILADTRGEGALAASLYRLPAAGWQLAAAAAVSIRRTQGTLVTDSIEHRPSGLDARMRFYPAHPRQIEMLTNKYGAVMKAEQTAAAALLSVAKATGTAVPRALLDSAAHRVIAEQQSWAQQDSGPTARQQRTALQGVQPPVRRLRGGHQ